MLAEYSQTRFVAVFGLYQTICGVVSLTIGPISGKTCAVVNFIDIKLIQK